MTIVEDRLRALSGRYTMTVRRLREQTAQTGGLIWDRYANVDAAGLEAWTSRAVPVTRRAQEAAARLAQAYISSYVGLVGLESPPAVDVAAVVARARGGSVAVEDVFARPVITARKVLADGGRWEEAMTVGRDRAVRLVDDDVNLAHREAMTDVMRSTGQIHYYRRVPSGDACEFCLTAASQLYKIASVMPLHTRCNCGYAPVVGLVDPYRDYSERAANTMRAQGYVPPIVTVTDHGELGPVLGGHVGRDVTGQRQPRLELPDGLHLAPVPADQRAAAYAERAQRSARALARAAK